MWFTALCRLPFPEHADWRGLDQLAIMARACRAGPGPQQRNQVAQAGQVSLSETAGGVVQPQNPSGRRSSFQVWCGRMTHNTTVFRARSCVYVTVCGHAARRPFDTRQCLAAERRDLYIYRISTVVEALIQSTAGIRQVETGSIRAGTRIPAGERLRLLN
jgi:hypothetical protein